MKRSKDIIACTGGGSGGHVFPAFGVIDALSENMSSEFDVVWIGSKTGVERAIVEKRGIEYRAIHAGKLRRYFSLRNLIDAFKFAFGILESLVLLARLRPALVFSKGGFVSVGPVIAAGLLKIPVVAHESDYDPGLATRINMRFTDILCIPFEESLQFYSRSGLRVEVTGNPIRFDIKRGDAARGRTAVGFDISLKTLPLLLVQGGSLGARQINHLIRDNINELLQHMCIVHQTGDDSWDLHESIEPSLRDRYMSSPFFSDDYPDILAAADLVVSRSGAGSLWEIGICAKPAVFVPLVIGARGDQMRNAEFAERSEAALVLRPEKERDFASVAIDLMSDAKRRSLMASRWSAIVHDKGAANIAELIADRLERPFLSDSSDSRHKDGEEIFSENRGAQND